MKESKNSYHIDEIKTKLGKPRAGRKERIPPLPCGKWNYDLQVAGFSALAENLAKIKTPMAAPRTAWLVVPQTRPSWWHSAENQPEYGERRSWPNCDAPKETIEK